MHRHWYGRLLVPITLFFVSISIFYPALAYTGHHSDRSETLIFQIDPVELPDDRLADPAPVFLEVAKRTASDAQADDTFGSAISISGDTLVVGAPNEAGGPGDPLIYAGAAYVFERDQGGPGNWGQVAKLIAVDPGAYNFFGRSVSISGDTIVVGSAHGAYVFERDQGGSGNWGGFVKLIGSGSDIGNQVSISANTIAAGAANEVYVFERDLGGPDNWGESALLVGSDTENGDGFGQSVSISGDTIVVGAASENGGPGDPLPWSGAAYVFERNLGGSENWGEAAKLSASDAAFNDYFGWSVAISNDTIAVGAFGKVGGPGLWDAGAAYVFVHDSGGAGNWGEAAKLTPGNPESDDYFGVSIAISGDIILVGALKADDTGAAYFFARDLGGTGSWGQAGILKASDAQTEDRFAYSVAISGDRLAAGALWEAGGAGDPLPYTGAAYIFEEIVFSEQVFLPVLLR